MPTLHTANTVGKRSSSKYKEGQEVTGRILEVDVAKKRVSMTLKKLLCSDKLPVITTFQVCSETTHSPPQSEMSMDNNCCHKLYFGLSCCPATCMLHGLRRLSAMFTVTCCCGEDCCKHSVHMLMYMPQAAL